MAPFTGASDYATGFSTCTAGPTGQVFFNDHVFINSVCDGITYEFGQGGGEVSHPLASKNLRLVLMLAVSHDHYYGAGGDGFYRWDPATLTLGGLFARPPGAPRGVVGDPNSGDLILSTTSGIFRVSEPESASPHVTQVVTGLFDGIGVTEDGQRVYAAEGGHVVGYDRDWKKVVDVDLSSHGPDGVAVSLGGARINGVDVSDNVFVNSNDGTIERIDIHHGNSVSVVASGGTRGDFSMVGPDGCLYVTQFDRVEKMQPCFFQPTGDAGHQRSGLAAAIPSLNHLKFDFVSLLTSGLIASFLGLLIGFPSELFNSTLAEHYDEITGWFRLGRRKRLQAAAEAGGEAAVAAEVVAPGEGGGELPGLAKHHHIRSLVIVMAIGDAIYCFLDPKFGFDLASLATFVAVFVALGVTVLGFAWIYGLVLRISDHERGHLRAFPAALVIAALCVLVSRATGFLPGYCYGLMAAFAVVGAPPKHHQGRASTIAALFLLAVSLGAYVAWTPIDALARSGSPGIGVVFLDALLASVFLFGIQSVVFGLVPIRFLEGEKVVAWSRVVWIVVFGFALFAFVHVLLNPASGYLGRPSYVSPFTVALLFGGFGVVSVAFWGFFRLREKKPETVPAA